MKFSYILPLIPALVAAAPMPAPASSTSATVFPPSVQIQKVTYGGTGCPSGTLKVGVAQNGTVFGLLFDQFTASIGSGIDVSENRKNCQLNFDVIYSPGYQYQVVSADYHGYASLDSGVTGTISTNFYFSGQTDDVSSASKCVSFS
jgi:hypothetical protein